MTERALQLAGLVVLVAGGAFVAYLVVAIAAAVLGS